MINIFIISSVFYISYIKSLFGVAKIMGLPARNAVNNFVREVSVSDVVSH